uniref:(northern house mosquito) hypothetical protein n=1 Tax=Culex pipiens TaxID=7175 RepID=A0A8D8HUE9_CULPI
MFLDSSSFGVSSSLCAVSSKHPCREPVASVFPVWARSVDPCISQLFSLLSSPVSVYVFQHSTDSHLYSMKTQYCQHKQSSRRKRSPARTPRPAGMPHQYGLATLDTGVVVNDQQPSWQHCLMLLWHLSPLHARRVALRCRLL